MGPQSRLAEFNLRVVGCWGYRIRRTGPLSRRRSRAHFPRGERYDRLSGRQKPRLKVARPSGGVL